MQTDTAVRFVHVRPAGHSVCRPLVLGFGVLVVIVVVVVVVVVVCLFVCCCDGAEASIQSSNTSCVSFESFGAWASPQSPRPTSRANGFWPWSAFCLSAVSFARIASVAGVARVASPGCRGHAPVLAQSWWHVPPAVAPLALEQAQAGVKVWSNVRPGHKTPAFRFACGEAGIASPCDTDEQVMFQESSQEGSALVTTAQEPLQEVAEWFFGWLRPKTFLPEKEMNKVRDFAQGLQRYAMVAEARAHKAEEELEKVAEERQLMAAELQRARKELQLISRYAEEVENERDSVQAELEALRSGSGAAFGAAQAEELAQLSRRIAQIAASASGSSGTAGVSAASGTAAVGAALPPPPSILATAMAASGTAAQEKVLQLPEGRSPGDMSLEELKAECAVWGLPADGPLAAVRGRIRAARARDRGRLGGS
ncbi:unnamed protein product [Polarella glacialis]|uniref:Uncharacterized protein n=1 Tax=Polarella glacialis TaxID=89957 RepID=A0A813DEX3_POLGL|nr:unnamed protein product [Polarella glacialis]